MEKHELLGAIESQLAASPPVGVNRFSDILNWVRTLGDAAFHNLGGEAAVIAIGHGLYDKYVAPIDIPFVPGNTEPGSIEGMVIDAPAKMFITAGVKAAHKAVHVEPTP